MAQVPNSSLPFNDNGTNGTTVQASDWNQLAQVLQAAINDNFYRIVEKFNLLNADGTQNKSLQVANTSGTTNVVQMQMGSGITISAVQSGGNITFAFSIANGAITESMLANGILQDVFYTQAQVQNLINSASYSKTIQTGTAFPSSPVDGEQFYRTDLHTLYTYDFNLGLWYTGNRPFEVKSMSNVLSPSRQSFTRSTPAGQVNGTQVASNVLRLEQGRFHKAPFIEESSANALSANQSNIETDTTGFSTATSTLIVAGATISRDTSTYYQGSASLKVVTTATSGEGVETSSISASANSKYTASVWVNAPSGQSMQLLMRDYTNSVSATPVSFAGTGQWQRVSITITTGATAVTNLTMAVVTASATAVTFNIDCLQIENKPYMTTWITGGVTRNADSWSETLDKPLASRWSASLVYKPQHASNVSNSGNDRMLMFIADQNGNARLDVHYRTDLGVLRFQKTPDGGTTLYTLDQTVSFNAGDVVYVTVQDDPTSGNMTSWVQINNGAITEATLANSTAITDAIKVYAGCATNTGAEVDGTIECILHELASGETVTTDEVTALFGASDWGLGDYPNNVVTVDGSGNILPTGGMNLLNNKAINGKDTSGNLQSIAYIGSDNNVYLGAYNDALATRLWGSTIQDAHGHNLAQVLSGGYKIQSGQAGPFTPSTTGDQNLVPSVTFPTAYTSPPSLIKVGVVSTNGTSNISMIRSGSITATGFAISGNVITVGSSDSVYFWWEALGQ